jgi:hypothetical protein
LCIVCIVDLTHTVSLMSLMSWMSWVFGVFVSYHVQEQCIDVQESRSCIVYHVYSA